jgi:hypothetical protein
MDYKNKFIETLKKLPYIEITLLGVVGAFSWVAIRVLDGDTLLAYSLIALSYNLSLTWIVWVLASRQSSQTIESMRSYQNQLLNLKNQEYLKNSSQISQKTVGNTPFRLEGLDNHHSSNYQQKY